MFYMAKKEATPADSLKRPQDNSLLTQETYHCSYGPQDNISCVPEALTQKQPSQGSRVSEAARGESRKCGCLSQFIASRLYFPSGILTTQMQMAMLSWLWSRCQGCEAPAWTCSVSDNEGLGPHQLVEWQYTTQQIRKQHATSAMPRIDSNTADRDCFLNSQDIRNIAQKLAQLTWKLHDNEAQSVRLFYQQHSEDVFMYQEERSAQPQPAATQPAAANSEPGVAQADDSAKPAGDGQLQHPQKLVMKWMTPFMKGTLLKYGNSNIVLLNATFGTNHMKMPLYTGLVIDEFGNGVPDFMVLCQSVSQEGIGKWLAALLQHVQHDHPDWMCSCIMFADSIAEINAIR